jgi:hypothetical protein
MVDGAGGISWNAIFDVDGSVSGMLPGDTDKSVCVTYGAGFAGLGSECEAGASGFAGAGFERPCDS